MKISKVIICIAAIAALYIGKQPYLAKAQDAASPQDPASVAVDAAAQDPALAPGALPLPEENSPAGTDMPVADNPGPVIQQPPLPAAGEFDDKAAAEGVNVNKEKISLDLKGVDIIELFRILSIKTNLTIVPTKSVGGRVNIFLNNLTFDEALDVVLISQDLAFDRKGNIINIMTAGEFEKLYGKKYNEKRQSKTIKLLYAKPAGVFSALGQIKSDIGKIIADEASGTLLLIDIPEKLQEMEEIITQLDRSLETSIFDLKYAKSADMKTQLTGAVTSGTGELFVDERSGKVVVSDLPEKMKKIKRIVKAFDSETDQVFIEAEILQITLRNEFQRGINWEKLFKGNALDGLDFKGTFPVSPSFTPSPALTAASMVMSVGVLAKDKYNMVITFLESFGDTKILSRPRIAAINNQEAKIMVGAREAYITSTLSQAESTTVTSESIQFVDVGVKLNVVPAINTDGFVTMKIKPEVSSVRETLTTSLGSKIPIVETSEAETTVKVKDGTMIMIAGLMKEDKRKESHGVPGLSKIPIFGQIFRANTRQTKKTELIVFITPHIISGESTFAGTEKEKIIPADIVPEDMVKEMVSQKVEEIKVNRPPQENTDFSDVKQDQPVSTVNTRKVQSKAKGIKEFQY